MTNKLLSLVYSRRFWTAIVGTLAVILRDAINLSEDQVESFVKLCMAFVLSDSLNTITWPNWNKWLALFTSRRFFAVASSIVAVLLQDVVGLSPEQVEWAVNLIGSWVVADAIKTTGSGMNYFTKP